jgi:hypothetical protein
MDASAKLMGVRGRREEGRGREQGRGRGQGGERKKEEEGGGR